MKYAKYISFSIITVLLMPLLSCEDFVDVGVPNDKLVTTTVFSSDETAISAMQGIYYELFNTTFSGGYTHSVTVLAGISGDLLDPISNNNNVRVQIEEHEILTDNEGILNIWNSAYNIIYLTNNLLEGIEQSENISEETSQRLEGEARFVRAFTYFYLVNLYGEVPLVLSTDYTVNSRISQSNISAIYSQIKDDLELSIPLLPENYTDNERIYVNTFTSMALLARVSLYLEDWDRAEELSSIIISNNSLYEILPDLNQVFLANSQEAIWQLTPASRGNISTYTRDGSVFIGSFLTPVILNNDFVESFDFDDQRGIDWIGFYSGLTLDYNFSYKYKDRNSSNNITEYSMVMRLAEQYLIRAESRAHIGDLEGAINDINVIRLRAGLSSLKNIMPNPSLEDLIDEIMIQRKKELFTEWGHRWMDLKRTGKVSDIFNNQPTWENTDMLYPIPAAERSKNNSLQQNPGY